MVGDVANPRDIVIHKRNDRLIRISDCHHLYDALQYPLIFWKGQKCYQYNIPQVDPQTTNILPGKKVPCMDFYAYYLMIRGDFNCLLRFRKLFHQFIVDMYVKIESERLCYIANNHVLIIKDKK